MYRKLLKVSLNKIAENIENSVFVGWNMIRVLHDKFEREKSYLLNSFSLNHDWDKSKIISESHFCKMENIN